MTRLLQGLRRRGILLLSSLTPPCRHIVRIGLGEEPGSGNPLQRLRLRMHLKICAACRDYLQQARWMRSAARRSGEANPHATRTPRMARLVEEAKRRLRARLRHGR